MEIDRQLAEEAKALVVLRVPSRPAGEHPNGRDLPDLPRYSRIGDAEMKTLMKFGIDRLYYP